MGSFPFLFTGFFQRQNTFHPLPHPLPPPPPIYAWHYHQCHHGAINWSWPSNRGTHCCYSPACPWEHHLWSDRSWEKCESTETPRWGPPTCTFALLVAVFVPLAVSASTLPEHHRPFWIKSISRLPWPVFLSQYVSNWACVGRAGSMCLLVKSTTNDRCVAAGWSRNGQQFFNNRCSRVRSVCRWATPCICRGGYTSY